MYTLQNTKFLILSYLKVIFLKIQKMLKMSINSKILLDFIVTTKLNEFLKNRRGIAVALS